MRSGQVAVRAALLAGFVLLTLANTADWLPVQVNHFQICSNVLLMAIIRGIIIELTEISNNREMQGQHPLWRYITSKQLPLSRWTLYKVRLSLFN